MTKSQDEGNRVYSLIDSRVVVLKPWFPYNQVPSGKFSNMEGKGFKVLINYQLQGIRVCDLSYFGVNSISQDQVFRGIFLVQGQI